MSFRAQHQITFIQFSPKSQILAIDEQPSVEKLAELQRAFLSFFFDSEKKTHIK